ncbi:MAG TPA: hypothetical protein VH092_23210 [Urbifossiella sp.]|jgi:hypothetical protein|nr:hypothetical protein [Urbifossiella sp.]
MTDETPEAPDTGSPVLDALQFVGGAAVLLLATMGANHVMTELFRRKDKCREIEP